MKTYFSGYGFRETASWSCPHCGNFSSSGMDLAVADSKAKHLMVCPKRLPVVIKGVIESKNERLTTPRHVRYGVRIKGLPCMAQEWTFKGLHGDFELGDRVKITVEKE
jgi:hypothetical protein